MRVLSLFAGVGGLDLGLERAGHEVVAQVEQDPRCRAVLERHWPDVPRHDDVVTFADPPRADLVCGGFPCQDLSVAGRREGLSGERSGLFFEAARIADRALDPGGWLLLENVPGLLSSNRGRDFGIVLATMADLGFHDLAWRVLDSRYLGVPQRRRRIFILARRARGRRAAEVLLEPESQGGNHQASREEKAKAAAGVGPSVARTGATQSLSTRFGRTGADLPDAEAGWLVAGTLTKRYGKGINTTIDDGAVVVSPPPYPDRVRKAPRIPGRVDDTVTAFHATQDPIDSTNFTPALGANGYIGVMGRGGAAPACPVDRKPDGPRYAQVGNAVTVNVAEWIGRRLKAVEP